VGALAVLLIRRPAPVEPAWIAARHAQPLPPPGSTAARDTRILTMSPTDASAWLSRRLGAKIPPVDLELVGLELRGAMGWAERGRRIGLLRYTRGLEPWSLLVIPSGGELTGSREVTAGRQRFGTSAADGSLMAAWHSRGTLFVLAGPGPEGELLRAARQAARACEVGR
jgi:anti-sigma factor RsiW